MSIVLAELSADLQQAVARTRERVARLHAELPRHDEVRQPGTFGSRQSCIG